MYITTRLPPPPQWKTQQYAPMCLGLTLVNTHIYVCIYIIYIYIYIGGGSYGIGLT